MTIRRRAFALLIATTVTAAVALAVVSPATGSSPWKPTSSKARGPALADAHARLRSFRLPPGSRRVASLPKSLHLGGPFETIGSPNFLDVHALWVSSSSVETVRTYLSEHAPPGSRHSLTGEDGDRHGTYRWDYGYSWPELAGVASERELLVGVVARPGGGSALRADAQAVWLESRPRTERIPAGAHFLEVVETLGAKSHTASTGSVKNVAATARLINSFPIVQRTGPTTCTEIPSEQAILRATFRTSPGGPVLAETKQTLPEASCQSIGLTIRGQEQRPLVDEHDGLTKRLQSLLSLQYKTPLSQSVAPDRFDPWHSG